MRRIYTVLCILIYSVSLKLYLTAEAQDLSGFNDFLRQTSLYLPDMLLDEELPDAFPDVAKVKVENFFCTDLSIEEITSFSRERSQTRTVYTVDLTGLKIFCRMKWTYFKGSFTEDMGGSRVSVSDASSLRVSVNILSEPYDGQNFYPTGLSYRDCDANIDIDEMDFWGGFRAAMMELLDNILIEKFNELLSEEICGQIESSLSRDEEEDEDEKGCEDQSFFHDILEDLHTVDVDPLQAQNALSLPENKQVMNFQTSDIFAAVSDSVNEFLGDSDEGDLGINNFIYENLLDEDGIYRFELESLDGIELSGGSDEDDDSATIQCKDMDEEDEDLEDMIEHRLELVALKITGLDSFQSVNALNPIAPQTLENYFVLGQLKVEATIKLDLFQERRTSNTNFYFEIPDHTEYVRVKLRAKNIRLDLSFFSVLDYDLIQELQIYNFLNVEGFMPCLRSIVYGFEWTELGIEVDSYDAPVITYLFSPGIDEIANSLSSTVANLYADAMESVIPNFIGEKMRNVINNRIDEMMEDEGSLGICPVYSQHLIDGKMYIDFRDLLLEPEDSLSAGGSGQNQYGNLIKNAFGAVTNYIMSDDNGSPNVNSLIESFTEDQSGFPGTFDLQDSNGVSFNTSIPEAGIYQLNVSSNGMRVENLNTVGYPIEFLQPRSGRAHVLDNHVSLGSSKPLRVSTNVAIQVESSHVNGTNDILLNLEMSNIQVLLSILARVNERSFMEFPINSDIKDMNCWLATIPAAKLDDYGMILDESEQVYASILDFDVSVDEFKLNAECIDCDLDGMTELPHMLNILNEIGISGTLGGNVLEHIKRRVQENGLRAELARIISTAQKKCAHHPDYTPDYAGIEYEELPSDDLFTKEEAETIVLAAATSAQVGLVLGILSMPEVNGTSDSLSAQEELTIKSEGLNLIDFTGSSQTSTGIIVDKVFSMIASMLESVKDDPLQHNSTTLGINSIVRSLLLDTDGSFSLDLNYTLAQGVRMESVKIDGLDSFVTFGGINPIAAQTLESTMTLENLKIEINVLLSTAFTGERLLSEEEGERMKISFELAEIEFSVALLIGLLEDRLGSLQLGTLLHIDQIRSCFLSSIHQADVSELKVSIGSISGLNIEGFLSDENRDIIENLSNSLISEYSSSMFKKLPYFTNTIGRGYLNNMIESYLSVTECTPYQVSDSSYSSYIDFRDLFLNTSDAATLGGNGDSRYGDLFILVMDYIKDQLMSPNENGTPSINEDLIEPLTLSSSNISGTFHIPGDVVSKTIFLNESVSVDDTVTLLVQDVSIENLNTINYPLEFLEAQQSNPYILNNRMVIGSSTKPLHLSSRITLALQGDTSTLYNNFVVAVELANADLLIPLFLKVKEALLLSIPFDDIMNPYCWIASIPSPEFNEFGLRDLNEEVYAKLMDLNISASDIDLRLDCISCSSTGISELGDFLVTPEGQEKSNEFGRTLLNYTQNFLKGDYTQSEIDRFIFDAVGKCPHRQPEYSFVEYEALTISSVTSNASQITFVLCGFVATFLFFITSISQFTKRKVRINNIKWLKTLPQDEINNLYSKQMYADKKDASQKIYTSSICRSSVVPVFVRVFIPLVIISNIGLFLSGHISLGGTVLVDLIFAGEEVRIKNFFEFAIAETVKDMWEEGLFALSVILFLSSVLWPYIRQFILLVLWFTPPSLVSTTKRGNIFLQLDALGKWSITDIYVLMITLIVFRITVSSPNISGSNVPSNLYGLELLLVPMWGLYANMTAQILSQISSHIIIHWHRQVVKTGYQKFVSQEAVNNCIIETDSAKLSDVGVEVIVAERDEATGKQFIDSLSKHTYSEGPHKNNGQVKVQNCWNVSILIFGLVTILLLLLGCTLPSLRLEVMGMAGRFIAAGSDLGSEALVQYHSVFTMISVIMSEARYLDSSSHYVGLGVLCTLLVCTSFIVPISLCVLLLVLWFRPMTRKVRKRLVLTIEILGAWQYIEVYLIAAFLGMWQIGDVTESMVGDFCEPLDGILGSLSYFGVVQEEDARCFYAFATLEIGSYILLAASPMLSGLTYMVLKAEKQQIKNLDDIQDEKNSSKIPDIPLLPTSSTFTENKDGEDETKKEELTNEKLYKEIRPIPAEFTDLFRFVLSQEERSSDETSPSDSPLSQESSTSFFRDDGTRVNVTILGSQTGVPVAVPMPTTTNMD